jgi:hypothetical protein
MTKRLDLRSIVMFVVGIILCAVGTASFAQGVAGGPFTNHSVDPGPVVNIGNAAAPIPIDLDPLGPPWNKSIGDPQNVVVGVMPVDIVETILNVGTEPWGDWHEILLPPPAGLPPHTWLNVVGLSVNGNPIGFTAAGFGTQSLTLNNFSQPVLPGDVFGIHKQALVDGSVDAMGGPLIRMQQYPTPWVPEPTSIVLVATAGLALSLMRRR